MSAYKGYIMFIIKFVGSFCVVYFASLAIIGLSVPGGRYYSLFVSNYFNYIKWLRLSLFWASKNLLSLFGVETLLKDEYILKIKNGREIRVVYSCLAYGVMSFWIAFVVANSGSWVRKFKWVLGGVFLIWCINVIRLSLLLVAINNRWPMPLGINHHTWFNIVAYGCIFILIYFFDKSAKSKSIMQNGSV